MRARVNIFPAAAGIATLKTLRELNPYPETAALAKIFADKTNHYAQKNKLAVHCQAYGGVFTLFFTAKEHINNLEDVKSCNTELFAAYYRHMLSRGIYMSPSQFELNFVSTAHRKQEIESAADAAVEFLAQMK